jgi:hypothetical protein
VIRFHESLRKKSMHLHGAVPRSELLRFSDPSRA